MLNGLDLFSGIGGITLALSEWVRPLAYCEIESYAQGVLLSRMSEGQLPRAPIWDDVRSLSVRDLPRDSIDIIYGGFPCQPYSSAARGRNQKCTIRAEFGRLVKEVRPRYVFAENTTLEAVHGLAKLLDGYTSNICSSCAPEVGRSFIGKRYWMVAEANSHSESVISIHEEVGIMSTPSEVIWENTTPKDIRVDDGLSHRMDRNRALGNAVVPLQAKEAFKELMGIK